MTRFEARMDRLANPPEDCAPSRLAAEAERLRLPKWDIWMEGYSATGEYALARCIRRGVHATNFTEAAREVGESLPENLWGHFDPENLTIWGCALSPDEEEARSSFG